MTFNEILSFLPKEIIEQLKETEQNPKWHPEGNVYNHLKLVYEQVENNFPDNEDLKVCSVFHDLGKIDTTHRNEEGKLISYNHENYAKEYINKYLPETYDKEKIKEICYYHMRAHLYNNGELKNNKKRKEFESLKYFDEIMKFSICDEKGVGK